MATQSARAVFLAKVYDVAYRTGQATQDCVAVIQHVRWTDSKLVEAIAAEFKLGRVAAYLKIDRAGALKVAAKSPYKPDTKDTDSKRDLREHKAWRAAISGWSHVSHCAGMNDKRTGAKRAPKKRTSETKAAPVASTPVASPNPLARPQEAVFAMSKPESHAEFHAMALNVASLMSTMVARWEWPLEYRSVFADTVTKLSAIAKGVTGEAVKPAAPSTPVPEPSKPSFKALKRLAAIDASHKPLDKELTQA